MSPAFSDPDELPKVPCSWRLSNGTEVTILTWHLGFEDYPIVGSYISRTLPGEVRIVGYWDRHGRFATARAVKELSLMHPSDLA